MKVHDKVLRQVWDGSWTRLPPLTSKEVWEPVRTRIRVQIQIRIETRTHEHINR